MIKISPTNPIRFKGSLDYDFDHSKKLCYLQKYQTGDSTKIQVWSDEGSAPLMSVLKAYDNSLVHIYNFTHVAPSLLIDEDFEVFETEVNFTDLGPGEYIFYFNDNQYSHTVKVEDVFEDTVLIKYRNSYNKFGVIFDTDVLFQLRLEGTVQNYEPKSDDEIYNDQVRNSSKLYSLPYNVFTFFAGTGRGLPDYMLDLVNRAFSCDMIKIDDHWFEKTEDAEWEMYRVDDYPFAGMSINIMPAINNIAEQIKIDEGQDLEPEETMIIQRYSNNFQDVTGSLPVQNIFEKNSVLNYIRVYRKAGPYVLRVGTTPEGNEIFEGEITNILHTINLFQTFNSPETVYLSGMVGANDISLVWDKVDRFFNPGSGADPTPQPAESLGLGAVIEWHGSTAELEAQFNLVTGLGRDTGDWIGWAICNGENGTPNMQGRVPLGYQRGSGLYGTIGQTGGTTQVQLTTNNLPKFRVKLFANHTRTAQTSSDLTANSKVIKGTTTSGKRDEKYSLLRDDRGGNPEPTLGESSEVGGDVAFGIMQPYLVLLFIKKIF